MAFTSGEQRLDYLVDRRNLTRRLGRWRLAALGLAAAGVIVAAAFAVKGLGSGAHIARLEINGLITGDDETVKLIKRVADSSARGALVAISSPGGTTAGSERLYNELRILAGKKPTVAVVREMAASGGYIVALGAERIVAEGNSIVGSIGVLVQYPDISKLMDTVGVKVEEIKSSPLKAAPNMFEPASPEAKAALRAVVDDSFAWFKSLVKERRNITDAELARVTDGRVFTGRQAVPLRLVDALGGQREAIDWLESVKGVPKALPVREWSRRRSLQDLGMLSLAGAALDALGISGASQAAQAIETALTPPRDGLASIWRPSSSQ